MIKRMVLVVLLMSISLPCFAAIFTQGELPLSLKNEIIKKGIWTDVCPVPLNRLRLLKISYYGMDGKYHDDGEMVVMDAAADHVLKIFKKLYNKRFPIEKIRGIENYDGSDDKSMEDNNSSAFNCRPISGGKAMSIHSYGLAIDINTVQNPFVVFSNWDKGEARVMPAKGARYLNRTIKQKGMNEEIADMLINNGFSVWGGYWKTPIDWQHFQTSRTVAMLLAEMQPQHAREFFNVYVKYNGMLNNTSVDERTEFIKLYRKNPDGFIKVFGDSKRILNMKSPQEAIAYIESRI